MFFGNRASPNWAAHTDTQQHDAAARRLLRAGGLQRKGFPQIASNIHPGSIAKQWTQASAFRVFKTDPTFAAWGGLLMS